MYAARLLAACTFASALLAQAALAQTPDPQAQHIMIHKNPDVGSLTQEDLAHAQQCKDDYAGRVEERAPHLAKLFARDAPEAYEALAIAIEVCLRAGHVEGVHSLSVTDPIGRPLLR
jgi:hypothetical protein